MTQHEHDAEKAADYSAVFNEDAEVYEARGAIRAFAKANGRQWKSKLRALWTKGKDTGSLRLARNVFGPSDSALDAALL